MMEFLARPWPWYVAGPIIGLFVPVLYLLDNKQLGISSNLRHLCAAIAPGRAAFLRYDWWREGRWNLAFLAGVLLGGTVAVQVLGIGDVAISAATRSALGRLGLTDFSGLAPREIFSLAALLTWRGAVSVVGGGLLVGFGSAWAGGCTSGHAISGLATLDRASLLAVVAFFAGGLLCLHYIQPLLF